MSDQVFYKVISEEHNQQEIRKHQYKLIHNVTLRDYKRCQVRGELYPASIKSIGDKVSGVLISSGLTSEDIRFLDEFEGDEYSRVPVEVVLNDGNMVEAQVYEWIAGDGKLLLDKEWELDSAKIDEFLRGLN